MNGNTLIKIKRLLLCAFVVLCVCGCDFSEKCTYTGSVEILTDWDGLWQHLQPTDELTAVFYNDVKGTTTAKVVERGTALPDIPSGASRLLVYNAVEGVELKENGTEYPELLQSTYYNGMTLMVKPCPMVCVSTDELTVPVGETTYQLVKLTPVVKQLTLSVTVTRNNTLGNPVSAEALLGGVYTGYSIEQKVPIGPSAAVSFPLSKGTDGKLSHSFYVLGMNAGTDCLLSLTVKYASGEVRVEGIDLNGVFEDFTKDVLDCGLTVDTSISPVRVTLTKAEQRNY